MLPCNYFHINLNLELYFIHEEEINILSGQNEKKQARSSFVG